MEKKLAAFRTAVVGGRAAALGGGEERGGGAGGTGGAGGARGGVAGGRAGTPAPGGRRERVLLRRPSRSASAGVRMCRSALGPGRGGRGRPTGAVPARGSGVGAAACESRKDRVPGRVQCVCRAALRLGPPTRPHPRGSRPGSAGGGGRAGAAARSPPSVLPHRRGRL